MVEDVVPPFLICIMPTKRQQPAMYLFFAHKGANNLSVPTTPDIQLPAIGAF